MGRVPRFYADARLKAGGSCELSEESGHHALHVLRVQPGDEVILFDGHGGEYAARIASVRKLRLSLDVLEHRAIERESPLRVTLVQGVSSGERMEFTIRKAVELGVSEIIPVLAAASVARPKGERAAARQVHWQRIAISACEQSGRNRVPPVRALQDLSLLKTLGAGSHRILLTPRAEARFSGIAGPGATHYTVAAGPEAGFDDKEEGAFAGAGFVPASLGPRVLRTETAALAALAALNALRGDS
jgi:16S rRNA (uracil1498-N3)-methyltransferase